MTERGLRSLSRWDRDVGRMVAGLIDGELERRVPESMVGWTGHHLRSAAGVLSVQSFFVRGIARDLAAVAIDKLLPYASVVEDPTGHPQPAWRDLETGDGSVPVPDALRAIFPPGAVTPFGFGLALLADDDRHRVELVSYVQHRVAVKQHVDALLDATGSGEANPYRGRTLEVDAAGLELVVRVAPAVPESRSTLALPDEVWEQVDRNTHRVVERAGQLAGLGLGINRGLLLAGPPGTGKTALTRVVANELSGRATCLIPSAAVMTEHLHELYDLAEEFAPALVVLEDIDLIVGRRNGGPNGSLNDFLTAVDGATTGQTGTITIATTNDLDAIDPAARRAARFDHVIELPLPPQAGREAIWARYLDALDGEFDISRLAGAARGASGADIREVVRRAVLSVDGPLTTAALLEFTREAVQATGGIHGTYL